MSLPAHVERLIELALEEDLLLGDVTSEATIDPAATGEGRFLVKEELVLAGTAFPLLAGTMITIPLLFAPAMLRFLRRA